MTIREIIAADPALYADMRESLRRQSVDIVYESEQVLITLEKEWKMYTVAAADLEEAKREIEKLNEEDTFFVVHDTELKDYLCDCLGYIAGEGCVQSVYTKPEPPKRERRLEIRHPDDQDFAYVQANYHMGDGYELYNNFKSDDFFAGYLNGQIMGFIGLHSEGAVGLLHIDKAHRGKGYGYEMAAFMLAHQLEKGRIPYGQIYESNKASLELNASLGMELSEGRLYWVTNKKRIVYKEIKEFQASDMERLFLSVNWESGRYPEKLVKAMQNSSHVVSAWDGDRLVGLIRALDDGETVAFLHYLLVDPEYQGKKIGEELMKRILAHFENHLYVKIMPSDPKTIPFYERFGFRTYENYSAMVRKKFE